jgi:hypothetical protein
MYTTYNGGNHSGHVSNESQCHWHWLSLVNHGTTLVYSKQSIPKQTTQQVMQRHDQ